MIGMVINPTESELIHFSHQQDTHLLHPLVFSTNIIPASPVVCWLRIFFDSTLFFHSHISILCNWTHTAATGLQSEVFPRNTSTPFIRHASSQSSPMLPLSIYLHSCLVLCCSQQAITLAIAQQLVNIRTYTVQELWEKLIQPSQYPLEWPVPDSCYFVPLHQWQQVMFHWLFHVLGLFRRQGQEDYMVLQNTLSNYITICRPPILLLDDLLHSLLYNFWKWWKLHITFPPFHKPPYKA